MESVLTFANYIVSRYQTEYGAQIDEMKLHKLLYFAQRESLIQLGKPLFNDTFSAWKYGPVSVAVRNYIKQFGAIQPQADISLKEEYVQVFDKVFAQYAEKNSWSLSRLSHGEFSWQNARQGLDPNDYCDRPMTIEDIKVDADRIRLRRFFISKLGASQKQV